MSLIKRSCAGVPHSTEELSCIFAPNWRLCQYDQIIFQVVGNAVRQLQHLVTDDSCIECYDLFVAESKNRGTGGNCGSAAERQIAEIIYQKKAEKLLADENCMKVIIVSSFSKFD